MVDRLAANLGESFGIIREPPGAESPGLEVAGVERPCRGGWIVASIYASHGGHEFTTGAAALLHRVANRADAGAKTVAVGLTAKSRV